MQPLARARSQFLAPAPEMLVREREELIPVVCSNFMLAGADMVANRVHDRLVQRRHLVCVQPLLAEQAVNRPRGNGGKEFAARIGPLVLLGAA